MTSTSWRGSAARGGTGISLWGGVRSGRVAPGGRCRGRGRRSAAGGLFGAVGRRVGQRRVVQLAVAVEQRLAVGADQGAGGVEHRLAVGPQQRAVGGDLLGGHLLATEGLA